MEASIHSHSYSHPLSLPPPSSSSSIPSLLTTSTSVDTTATTPPDTASPSSSSTTTIRPHKSDDWQEYRPVIEQLYRYDQLKLRDVKRYMERTYNFVASEKQYKDRLALWHVRKNIKAKEVQVMLRKQQRRAAEGKRTAFRVGGQTIDSKRISRFVRRYGKSFDNVAVSGTVSSEKDTPSDMSCYTPEPEDRPTSSAREGSMTPFQAFPYTTCGTPPDMDLEELYDDDDFNDSGKNTSSVNETNGTYDLQSFLTTSMSSPVPPSSSSGHSQCQNQCQDEGQIQQQQQQQQQQEEEEDFDSIEPRSEPIKKELTWDDLAAYQERMAGVHRTIQEALGNYIVPYDDNSVGCLANGQSRLFG